MGLVWEILGSGISLCVHFKRFGAVGRDPVAASFFWAHFLKERTDWHKAKEGNSQEGSCGGYP